MPTTKHVRRNIFQSTNLVKPLYRNTNFHSKILKVQNVTTNTSERVGLGTNATQNNVKAVLFKFNNDLNKKFNLPGLCSTETVETLTNDITVYSARNYDDMTKTSDDGGNDTNVNVERNNDKDWRRTPPVSWLRWTPAPRRPAERIGSVVFRCLACQLGLLTTVVLWTMLWTFVIYVVEEPFEEEVSESYRRSQARLVIELATELRQITPISSQWLRAIERSQCESRELTRRALGRGARAGAARYWSVAGTFLFTVYVRTALGFGAPMPQTIVGRAATIAYACMAVPIHVYLMYNVSTCIASKLEAYFEENSAADPARSCPRHDADQNTGDAGGEISKKKESKIKRTLKRAGRILYFGYGLPVLLVMYHIFGAVIFGFLRNKSVIDSLMFPMQFTTTGGLEMEESHYRIIYGIYVDVAMLLIACTLAVLRTRGGSYFDRIGEEHHLFHTRECRRCE